MTESPVPTAPRGRSGPADDLYGLPLEEFTAARNALAKQLAGTGDAEAAKALRSLAKPPKTAWALNQVARSRPDDVARLLEVGERLRQAQEAALDGDAGALRAAAKAEQAEVERLLDLAAVEFGAGGGASEAARERMRRSLRAAALEPGAGELLRRGVLTGDLEPPGFGLEGFDSAATEPQSQPAGEREGPRAEARRQAKREADRLAKEAERVEQRAARLIDEAGRAERRARDARAEATRADTEAAAARRAADEAAGRLDDPAE